MQAVDVKIRGVLSELMKQPYLKEYYLVGGTNLALRYGHRTSIDIDLFVHKNFNEDDSAELNIRLKAFFGSRFETNSVSSVGVFGYIDDVKVDFVKSPFKLIKAIETIEETRMASPLDIGAMKIHAIVGRGSRKDFFDIHQLVQEYPLLKIMQIYQKKYQIDNFWQAKMALSYFGNAEDGTKRDNQFVTISDISWETIKKEILEAVNQLDSDMAVQHAVNFHKKNDYLGKEGINPTKALEKALKEKLGLVLTKPQLDLLNKKISKGLP